MSRYCYYLSHAGVQCASTIGNDYYQIRAGVLYFDVVPTRTDTRDLLYTTSKTRPSSGPTLARAAWTSHAHNFLLRQRVHHHIMCGIISARICAYMTTWSFRKLRTTPSMKMLAGAQIVQPYVVLLGVMTHYCFSDVSMDIPTLHWNNHICKLHISLTLVFGVIWHSYISYSTQLRGSSCF